MEQNKKGLERLKKAELIDIILRKDDVDKMKNARVDELSTKLSASEKLIDELKANAEKYQVEFKTYQDDAVKKHNNLYERYRETNSILAGTKRSRDELIRVKADQMATIETLKGEIAELKNKGKVNKVFGIIGCILIAVSVVLLLLV